MHKYTTEQARIKLGDIVMDATLGNMSMITYHGVPAAVVLSLQEWERLLRGVRTHVSSEDQARINEGHAAG